MAQKSVSGQKQNKENVLKQRTVSVQIFPDWWYGSTLCRWWFRYVKHDIFTIPHRSHWHCILTTHEDSSSHSLSVYLYSLFSIYQRETEIESRREKRFLIIAYITIRVETLLQITRRKKKRCSEVPIWRSRSGSSRTNGELRCAGNAVYLMRHNV
jgi:hypothetical protein